MSSISSIRLSGLATGMDTDALVTSMLTSEQNKIDKVQQKQQTITWQQEIYREVISTVKSFNEKYFSISSPNSIISSKAWNTLSVSSSNSNVITATGGAGANKVDYSFNVEKLAEPAKATSSEKLEKKATLSELGLDSDVTFSIRYGDGENEVSKPITIITQDTYVKGGDKDTVDDEGYKLDDNGNRIIEHKADTVESLVKKINNATSGEVKASFSDMTGKFSIESKATGKSSQLTIAGEDGTTSSDALDFLKLGGLDSEGKPTTNSFSGANSEIKVTTADGEVIELSQETNSFTIDGVTYNVHSTGESKITSKEDVSGIVENISNFLDDYNKIMDEIYGLITQKTNSDYPPLTDAQKEEMSEEEIEKWEDKAKRGILRNDSEMRKFMDDMQNAIFGDNRAFLNEIGISSHENYNNKGQLSLDVDKLTKALEEDANKVYNTLAGDSNSVFETMKKTMNNYVGSSSSIFARKAGLEKTASAVNNLYSEQLKKQQDTLKTLQNKYLDKEEQLYKKFALMESTMNKLNSQMNYLLQ